MAHAYGADSPRSIAALRCVLRPTTVLCGVAGVGCALAGEAATGRDLLLGAALAAAALIAVRLAARIPASHRGWGSGTVAGSSWATRSPWRAPPLGVLRPWSPAR